MRHSSGAANSTRSRRGRGRSKKMYRKGITGIGGVLAIMLMLTPGATWAAGEASDTVDDAVIQEPEVPKAPPSDEDGNGKGGAGDESTGTESGNGDSGDSKKSPQVERNSGDEGDKDVPEVEKSPADPEEDGPGGFTTLALDDGALVWTVKDQNGQLVPGAKIRVQGQATSVNFWNGSWTVAKDATVEDCTTGSCAGMLDQDPRPGYFNVPSLGAGHSVQSNERYRVRQDTPPEGYRFVNPQSTWQEIPGSSGAFADRTKSIPNPWPNDVWDFGDFPVRKLEPKAPVCEPGYVYGLSETGWIRQVTPNGTVSNFGSQASGVSSFNGLGIGPGGEKVFAYERSGNSVQSAAIWSFDTTSGQWTNTGVSVNSTNDGGTVGFVAGGVDLNTGKYYIGGFSSDGKAFRIWEYVPGATSATYKGYINTSAGAGGSNNGDLAFDSAGNLFVVRGSGSTTTVFSVTAANFQAANGGLITSAGSTSVSTMSDVNGVAFDASGKGYLGSGGVLRSYDMPGWTSSSPIVNSGLNSTDLATCSSPATVTLEKNLPGGRVNSGDQFKLELKQGTQVLGEATTTGSATGVQEERVGPLPVMAGTELTFNESFVGGANQADYATSWQCTSDGDPIQGASGNLTSGSVTVPVGADAVLCQFTNTPLVATVDIHKEITGINGVETPGVGWTVGTQLGSPTSGTATLAPAVPTQPTNSSGDASWSIRFSDKSAKVDVTVSEEMESGYEFNQGICVVEPLSGEPREQVITAFTGETLSDVAPGDTVTCQFLNKQLPATVQVDKKWTINGGDPIDHGDQPDGLTADLTLDPDFGETPGWGDVRGGFAINDKVTIGETAARDAALLPGCTLGDPVISGDGITGTKPLDSGVEVTLANAANSYTITNPVTCKQSLTLIKKVDNEYDGTFDVGDEWLKGPSDWDGQLVATKDGDVTFNSGDTKSVDSGDYVLTEGNVPSYVFDSLTCDGAELEGDTVTVGLGQQVECTFTNAVAPGGVEWTKTGEGSENPLAGSEWKLTGPHGVEKTITDVGESGKFDLQGLPWGEYTLTETKAPAGYTIVKDPIEFTIGAGEALALDLGSIVNVQRDGPMLPLTGGIGRDHIYIAGILTVLLGTAAYFYTNRRRQA